MLIVGLTGGIGSGKSTVAKLFADLGVPIIDADEISRNLVNSDATIFTQLTQHFGPAIFTQEGQIDRRQLREIIFKSLAERKWLENLLHPLIITEMHKQIGKIHAPYCILVIPLLFETNAQELIDRSLVVDAPENVQINRAVQRDHCSTEVVKAIMQNQLERNKRLALADDIISNDQGLDELKQQVQKMHNFYVVNKIG